MEWIITILIGILVGLIYGLSPDFKREKLFYHARLGLIGAVSSKLLFYDVLGYGSTIAQGTYSFWGVLWGFLGAVILMVVVNNLHFTKKRIIARKPILRKGGV